MSEQIHSPSRQLIHQVLTTMNPTMSQTQLDLTTSKVMATLQVVSDSSPNLEEYKKNIMSCSAFIRASLKDTTALDQTVSSFENEKQKIFKKYNIKEGDPTSAEIDLEIEAAALRVTEEVCETKESVKNKYCGWQECTITQNLKKCSGCLKAMYCSVACQNKAWPTHKKVCQKNKS